MRRPSFQFYPADWRNNAKLRRCSFAERGVWLEVMCLMHDSEEYGLLRWPLKDIAQAVGCRLTDLNALISKGVIKGAEAGFQGFTFTPYHAGKSGAPVMLVAPTSEPVWFSSRMVTDEYVRLRRGTASRFTNERQPNPKPKGEPNQPPNPPFGVPSGDGPTSSSASSSTNNKQQQQVPDTPEGKPQTPAAAAVFLRSLEASRNKAPKITSGEPRLLGWVEQGVSYAQLREAWEFAVADRVAVGEDRAINAGFLDVFVAKVVNPVNGKAKPTAVRAKPWFIDTWSALETKARELGIEQVPDETPPTFRARVLQAAGVTREQVQAAERDWSH